MTNDGANAYTYDAENRVVSVDGGATAQYRYDHQNRRLTKLVGSSWTHYIWEGAQVIGEHDATTAYSTNATYQVKSARVDYIYSSGRMINSRQRASSTAPWTTRYYLSDRLSARTTLDTSGNVLGRQAHLPFGEDFGESGTQEKHHFTTYERDAEAGLDYAINRHSQIAIGRFQQADRMSGHLELPQSLNRYSYGRNDPVNTQDPLGLFLINCSGQKLLPFGVTFLLDWVELPEVVCFSLIIPIIISSIPRPPPRLYAGFSSGNLQRIEKAREEAVDLLTSVAANVDVDNDCRRNLSARVFSGGRTINVTKLIRTIAFSWRVKPDTEDETVWGPFDIINGADSRALDIVAFRAANPGAGGFDLPRQSWQDRLVLGVFRRRACDRF